MRYRSLKAGAVLALCMPWACGLDAVGSDDGDGRTDSNDAAATTDAARPSDDANVTPNDAGNDATTPDPCEATGTTCSAPLTQAGWTPVIVPQANAACPDGYQATDLVTNPRAEDGACACGTPQIAEPSCATDPAYTGKVGTTCDGNLSNGSTYIVSGDTCMPFNTGNGSTLAAVGKYDPIKKLGDGSCTSQAIKDPSHLESTSLRLCTPSPACVEHTCTTGDTAAAKICVAHDGEAACPAGFPTKLANAAGDATLDCSACSCKVTGQCGDAVLHYYGNPDCSSESASRVIDGTCRPLTGSTATPKAYRYEAQPQFQGEITKSSDATVGLDPQTLRTICCR